MKIKNNITIYMNNSKFDLIRIALQIAMMYDTYDTQVPKQHL